MKPQKIASFRIDHTKLDRGVYLSRIDESPSIYSLYVNTYDIRVCKPYVDEPMPRDAMHSIEHLGATFLRKHRKYAGNIIYFGPMGCATGFYLVIFPDGMTDQDVVNLVKEMFEYVAKFPEMHQRLPGSTKKECGNYKMHWVRKASRIAKDFLAGYNWKMGKYPR